LIAIESYPYREAVWALTGDVALGSLRARIAWREKYQNDAGATICGKRDFAPAGRR